MFKYTYIFTCVHTHINELLKIKCQMKSNIVFTGKKEIMSLLSLPDTSNIFTTFSNTGCSSHIHDTDSVRWEQKEILNNHPVYFLTFLVPNIEKRHVTIPLNCDQNEVSAPSCGYK